MQPVITVLLVCFLFCHPGIQAQHVPYLEKKVTLHAQNLSLADAFIIIKKQTGVVFSYNPKQINDQKKFTAHYVKVPLRLVMDDLVRVGDFSYKTRGNYIILLAGTKKSVPAPTVSVLSGYVYNSSDGSALSNASVYIPSGRYSAVSDQFGHFSISLPKTKTSLQVAVAKENFNDTSFLIQEPSVKNVKLFLVPKAEQVATHSDSAITVSIQPVVTDTIRAIIQADTTTPQPEKRLSAWSNLNKMKVNLRNIKDTFLNNFSFSVVPPVSTNKLLSFNTVNKVSLNTLIGYSSGVKYAEVGGLLNINHGDVQYAQVAGIGNHVSGAARGAQIAGIYCEAKQVYGAQVGGIFAGADSVSGAQIAGIYCETKQVKGAQVGGIFTETDKAAGLQLGGVYCEAKQVNGAQVGGIFTEADTVKGFQLGGVFNDAQHLSGAQISGLFNYARTMNGFQFSVINISHQARGIPFGVFSFVKNGYHKIELSADEMQMITLGFRTGVMHFHNIVFAGIGMSGTNRVWTYGYGLGASFQLKGKWRLCTDISTRQLDPVNEVQPYMDLVNRVLVAAEFCPAKKISLSIGPTYNIRVADTRAIGYTTNVNTNMVSYIHDHNENDSSVNTKMWIGASISVKFL